MDHPQSAETGSSAEEAESADISTLRGNLKNLEEQVSNDLVNPEHAMYWTVPRIREAIENYEKLCHDLDLLQENMTFGLKDIVFGLEWLCKAREEKFIRQICPCESCESLRESHTEQKRVMGNKREYACSSANLLAILKAHLKTMQ